MAVTITSAASPCFEFFKTAGGNVRLRLKDTTLGFQWEAEITAGTWTTINTYMVTNDPGSTYQKAAKSAGALPEQPAA